MGEAAASPILKLIESFLIGWVTDIVHYIKTYDDNLDRLHNNLDDVCVKMVDIKRKVMLGKNRLEDRTMETRNWLIKVQMLAKNEELKGILYKNTDTAKRVVKMMDKEKLKELMKEESMMQEVMIKVVKVLREEIRIASEEDTRKIAEEDYKKAVEITVEMVKDIVEEFKNILKEDMHMAIIALNTLSATDIEKLKKDDEAMAEALRKAKIAGDSEEEWQHESHQDDDMSPLLPIQLFVNSNRVETAANKVLNPIQKIMNPLRKLMADADFKKVVPEAEYVAFGLDVIDGLFIKSEKSGQHTVYSCLTLSPLDYYHRFIISKAAENIVAEIKDSILDRVPHDPVTLPRRTVDLRPIPTEFLDSLLSRTNLLKQILAKIHDDQVNAIGLVGMGGSGKTTLAKEVIRKVKDLRKVMVEVTNVPDIIRIQSTIGDGISLPLNDRSINQRAMTLFNGLKDEKTLIILDNVWSKINLKEIGIPPTCKLLFTTRERNVCRDMGIKVVNTFEMGLLNANEARNLFKYKAGNQAGIAKYGIVVERLLRKCEGLPLAIVTTADSLKDKPLPSWEIFADHLENPITSQVYRDYGHINSVLYTSYKFIQVKEKRLFFLLACLFPPGSSVLIEKIMRYGIGLSLFQYVNNITEAVRQADIWASELVASSLLLEGDAKGEVMINDSVRAFAISFAAKEEKHEFLVEAVPYWLENNTLESYTAILSMNKNDYYILSKVTITKLQILILRGDSFSDMEYTSFPKMENLKVLSLSDMNLKHRILGFAELKDLRTLCMETCELGDITPIGQLTNLRVLSLRKSSFEKLPMEIGKLSKLQLLDLTECTSSELPLIPIGFFRELSQLEGLYMRKIEKAVSRSPGNEGTSTTENNSLPRLKAIEIKIAKPEDFPITDPNTIQNIDKFEILVGNNSDLSVDKCELYSRTLYCLGINDQGEVRLTLKALLQKADYLTLIACSSFKYLVNQENFGELRYLNVQNCENITSMVAGAEAPTGTFSNLETLQLEKLPKLEHVFLHALDLPELNEIRVDTCTSLRFVFNQTDPEHVLQLYSLISLTLNNVPELTSLVGSSASSEITQGQNIFFDGKVLFSSLQLLHLEGCDNFEMLWSNNITNGSFQNLKNLTIISSNRLSSVGPPSVFSALVQLETLKITNCAELIEVLNTTDTISEQSITFPRLERLELATLSKLKWFYDGKSKLEFPKLIFLKLNDLPLMKRFSQSSSTDALVLVPILTEISYHTFISFMSSYNDLNDLITKNRQNIYGLDEPNEEAAEGTTNVV